MSYNMSLEKFRVFIKPCETVTCAMGPKSVPK